MKHDTKRIIVGFLAQKIPMVATLLIITMIVVMIGSFLVMGAPSITWEFLTTAPEKANTAGGIYPAIIGTVMLVMLMTIAAVPIGAVTAIYLTEYAKQRSIFARVIRFAVNTLAGVPSVVFGLFGLGFFIQTIGVSIDEARWDKRMEWLAVTLDRPQSPVANGEIATIDEVQQYLTDVNDDNWIDEVATLDTYPLPELGAGRTNADYVIRYLRRDVDLIWGRPALIWAALTLALLTMPVVIVSVEESLRTVPREIREASLALGATKLETIRKVVVPNSLSGILTGSILAIGRGAGEVAPILFTGVIYSAQQPPQALTDQFMHLGYHLYILATQSPDVEATQSLQYATTLVLLGLTLALNMSGILLRSKIRKRQLA